MTHQEIVIGVGALALLGLLGLLSRGRRRARNAAKAAHETARAVSLFGRVLIGAALITGVQFAVIRLAHNNITLLVCVLAGPALLAAATAVKALTVTAMTTGTRGHR